MFLVVKMKIDVRPIFKSYLKGMSHVSDIFGCEKLELVKEIRKFLHWYETCV